MSIKIKLLLLPFLFSEISFAQIYIANSFGIGYVISNYKNTTINGVNIIIQKPVKGICLGIAVKGFTHSGINSEFQVSQNNTKLSIVEAAFSISKKVIALKNFNAEVRLLNGFCISRISDNNNHSYKWYGKTPVYASKTIIQNQNYFVSPSLSFEYQLNKKLSVENSYQYRFTAGNTQFGSLSDLNALSISLGIKVKIGLTH